MKCAHPECRIKIKLSFQFNCRCGLMYCKKHFNHHDCNFDYKALEAKRLTKNLNKVVSQKFEKI